MARLNVWVSSPYNYEISDEELAAIKKDIAESNTKAIENFISGIEQTFSARYFGDAIITGIYDDDWNSAENNGIEYKITRLGIK